VAKKAGAVPYNRYILFFALAIGVLAADLASKTWMFAHLTFGDKPWWIWPDVFGFQTNLNPGALFGMGPGRWVFFAAVSLVAVLAIVGYLFLARAASDYLLTIALGLVTGGILGNLYDRLALPGLAWPNGEPAHAVRDFILVMIGRWPWPTFNLADSALVCGAILLIWHGFFVKSKCEKPE
jgi:signal peptidase II